ncbi:MAG: aminoacyl-tRNA hydrolase [Candidatus Pacearchaeota archaeon]
MKLIVGFGHPGRKYEKTRHNLGFNVVDRFLKNLKNVERINWTESKKFKSDIAEFELKVKNKTEKIILAKPRTYMNGSGLAVFLLSSYFKLQPSDIWIIHDDIDLPLGNIRIRLGGSAGGHKGVDSIINSLKTDNFWRFRLGIGYKKAQSSKLKIKNSRNTEDFVLEKFSHAEQGKVGEFVKKASLAIEMALQEGLERTMNKYNTK